MDYPGFRKEVHALGETLGKGQGAADISHLKKMIAWSNTCGAVGVLTMWMSSPLGRMCAAAPQMAMSPWPTTAVRR
jgi:hypothetical protein